MKDLIKQTSLLILLAGAMSLLPAALSAMDGAGMAFKVSLSGKIYQRFSFLLEEDIRPQSDFRQAEWFLTTGEINYTFNPHLKAGVAYMLLCQYKASEELRNRYYLYASASYPVGNFTLSLRERFQSTYKTGADHPTNYLRSMLTLSYKISRTGLCPFAYAEIFNNTGHQGHMHTDRIRLSAGSDYRIDRHNALQLYYRYHIFNVYDPVNYKHAIGVTYSHKF